MANTSDASSGVEEAVELLADYQKATRFVASNFDRLGMSYVFNGYADLRAEYKCRMRDILEHSTLEIPEVLASGFDAQSCVVSLLFQPGESRRVEKAYVELLRRVSDWKERVSFAVITPDWNPSKMKALAQASKPLLEGATEMEELAKARSQLLKTEIEIICRSR